MREILFRGKALKTSEWVFGFVQKKQVIGGVNWLIHEDLRASTAYHAPIVINPSTIGQYTGLNDENGNKIFEGDIIRVKSFDYDYEYITKVYYSCHTLCVDVYGQDYDFTSIGFADDIWDDENCEYEIIGNIYDNAELLEV